MKHSIIIAAGTTQLQIGFVYKRLILLTLIKYHETVSKSSLGPKVFG